METKLKSVRIGNLLLREIEASDFLDYYEIGRSPKVCEYLNWGPFKRKEEALWVIENIFNERPQNGLPKGYAIVLDSRMIGMVDFHTINSLENSIEIGYVLHEEYWGKGIMRKCVSYMVSKAFEMGFDKVVLGSVIDNERSIRLIESLGFEYAYQTMAEMDEGVYSLAKYYEKYRS